MVRDYVVPFETVPRVKFTEEESIKLGTYAQDIVNYATENVVKFITGEKSLSEWDAYVAELNNMPVEDYSKSTRTLTTAGRVERKMHYAAPRACKPGAGGRRSKGEEQ